MIRLWFFLCLSTAASAQLREVAEVTFVLPEGISEDIEVMAVNEDILLVNFQEDYTKRENQVVVVRYNTQLEVTWAATAPVPRLFEPVSFQVSGQVLYYLLKEREGRKMHLLQFDFGNENVTAADFESITALEDIGFSLFNGQPLLYGLYNLKPVVEMHNLREKTAKVLPDIYNKNNELKEIFINPYRDEIYVFSSLRQNCEMQVATYDVDGKLLFRQSLGDKKHRIRRVEVRLGAGGEPFVMGTYNSACLDMTEGLFAGSLDLPRQIKYHSIARLPGYKASLTEKRRRRLQLRRERGKSDAVRQRAIFHVPVFGANGFLLATEFYNMQSTSSSSGQFSPGRASQFSEYKTWRVLVAEMDMEGNVLYDRLYKLEGDPFLGLNPQAAFLFKGEEFYTFLPLGNRLIYAGPGKSEYHPIFSQVEGFRFANTEARLFNMGMNTFIAHGFTEMRALVPEAPAQQIYFIKKFRMD